MSVMERAIATNDLAVQSVRFNRDRSTQYAYAYDVRSESVAGRVYTVVHEVRLGRWRCNCPATITCKHIRWSQEAEKARWWCKLLAALSDAEQREFLCVLRSRLGGPGATDDDRTAYKALTSPLLAMEAV